MIRKSSFICAFLCFFLASYSSAFETKGQDCSKCHTLSQDEAKALLKNIFPDVKIMDIRMAPSKGYWELFSESTGRKGLVYIDFAKKHLIVGSLISIQEKKNLTQERLTELNRVDVSQIPLEDAVVMGDPKAKIKVVVFDDPD